MIALGIVAWKLLRHYERNRYRREALLWLEEKERSLYETDMLLKRIAMRNYGRENVAALRGQAWIDLLNRYWKEGAFTAADADLVSEALYRRPPASGADFTAKAKRWIRYHRHALRDRI